MMLGEWIFLVVCACVSLLACLQLPLCASVQKKSATMCRRKTGMRTHAHAHTRTHAHHPHTTQPKARFAERQKPEGQTQSVSQSASPIGTSTESITTKTRAITQIRPHPSHHPPPRRPLLPSHAEPGGPSHRYGPLLCLVHLSSHRLQRHLASSRLPPAAQPSSTRRP